MKVPGVILIVVVFLIVVLNGEAVIVAAENSGGQSAHASDVTAGQLTLAILIASFYFLGIASAIVGLTWLEIRAISKGEKAFIAVKEIIVDPCVLRMLTVSLIIDAILILAVMGELNSNAASVFAGIAGYVLGGLRHGDGDRYDSAKQLSPSRKRRSK